MDNISFLTRLEKNIGIEFTDRDILKTAITHSSYANQKRNVQYNERLEFLGDSVLQLVISEFLYTTLRDKSEGELTRLRSLIVCENSLHKISKSLNLGEFILLSKGEELTGGRTRTSILADAVEAIIAAIYIDKGYGTSKEFIMKHFSKIINLALKNKIILDYKTRLQEILQKSGEINIEYRMESHEGPPHRRKFFIGLYVDSKFQSSGDGYSKKEAEQIAAKAMLKNMGESHEE